MQCRALERGTGVGMPPTSVRRGALMYRHVLYGRPAWAIRAPGSLRFGGLGGRHLLLILGSHLLGLDALLLHGSLKLFGG